MSNPENNVNMCQNEVDLYYILRKILYYLQTRYLNCLIRYRFYVGLSTGILVFCKILCDILEIVIFTISIFYLLSRTMKPFVE